MDADPVLAPAEATCVDEAVEHLRRIHKGSFLAYALEVGQYLLATFFGGDIERYHAQHRRAVAWNALLARTEVADMGLGGQTLRNYVLAWDVSRSLPPEVAEALPLTHRIRLARLRDPVARGQAASLAMVEGLSAEALQARLLAEAKAAAPQGRAQGRPPFHPVRKAVRPLRQALAFLAEGTAAEEIPAADISLALTELEVAARAIEAARGRLLARVRGPAE